MSTAAALRRNGGGDSTGVMAMVAWARRATSVDRADRGRRFSSGAMMTNVLAAQCTPTCSPAGSAFSGVPAGCFATTNGSLWNSQCSGGQLIKTAQQWGDQAAGDVPGLLRPPPGCSCGTAPRTRRSTTTTSAKPSSSGPTCTGPEPDSGLHRPPAVELDPHPVRHHLDPGHGRGHQHQRGGPPAPDERPDRLRHLLPRPRRRRHLLTVPLTLSVGLPVTVPVAVGRPEQRAERRRLGAAAWT